VSERWYRNAVIYSVDARTFQDSDDDGVGDLRGLMSRIDYLSRLGVTAIWLNPIHPSPLRDGGYDVTDHYGIDPSLGSLGDFADLMNAADERGLRVILDLVLNHTSDQHPWFQSALSDPRSPYRDWYVWSEEEPPDLQEGMVFPGIQEATWTYSDQASLWYHHRFYDFEPDLNIRNREVREELRKIVSFWERLGVSGFRIDAAPFVIEKTEPGGDPRSRDFPFLTELREQMSWRRGDAVFIAEANVEKDEVIEFFGNADGAANRVQMLFAFDLNQRLMLSLARRNPEVVAHALEEHQELPRHGQWLTFLRNHDEVDLSRLTPEERDEVYAAFGPDRRHQLYERGIRRRLASMMDGDGARLRMAYSLQFTMPGTPVLRHGDEIGMGEDLDLPERRAIRTPMQWSDTPNAGFSKASADRLIEPVIEEGPFSFHRVSVTDQRVDPESLLTWFERMLNTLRECEEIGTGHHAVIPVDAPAVLAHRAEAASGTVVFLHNLDDKAVEVELPLQPEEDDHHPVEVFGNREYDDLDLRRMELDGYGFRWVRIGRKHSRW
jgi:maltose alpha-D-glucosyltransferase / alpha-amylase